MAGRIKSIKITMNPTAKRTRDFPDSSAVKVKVKFTLEQDTLLKFLISACITTLFVH